VFTEDITGPLADYLDAHPEVGAVGAKLLNEDGSIQPSARRFPDLSTAFGGRTTWLTRLVPDNALTRRNLLTGDHVTEPTLVDWVIGACLMVRRRDFDAVGGMDEGFFLYWEDADLCRRLAGRGLATVYHPGVSVTHLYGRSSRLAADRSLVAFHRSAYRYFRKHGGRGAALAAPVVWAGLETRLAAKRLALRLRG
jgi:GT2 family glycosyltransferase